MRSSALVLLMTLAAAAQSAHAEPSVRLVTDEAEAVLAILEKRSRTEPIAEADWQRLFTSEGYRPAHSQT